MEIPATTMKKLSLIEPKQVNVEEFAGGVADARSKFVEWSERVRDRAQLYDPTTAEAMRSIERTKDSIDNDASIAKGISPQANIELQSFLKDRTTGLAAAIVRGNKDGIVSLEVLEEASIGVEVIKLLD